MIPGFVDLQINGYRGVDFTSANLTPEAVRQVSSGQMARGTLAYCPTVVTAAPAVYEHVLPILARACKDSEGAQILGIHVEGPFISPDDGPRGVHPQAHVRPPSPEDFDRLRDLADDRIAIITIAPEVEGAVEFIRHVVSTSQTIVSLGHHSGDAQSIGRAADAGARLLTHVGNGMAETIHRHLNPMWPMLADDRLTGMFISDGHHLPRELLTVCLRAKGVERFIVTSDMAHLNGFEPGEYEFAGVPVVLEPNGRLHRKGAYQLAGSASDMIDCMNVMAGLGELDLAGLERIGYRNALDLLGVEILPDRLAQAPKITFDGTCFRLEA